MVKVGPNFESGQKGFSSLASVQVVRAFVRLRQMLASNAELASKLSEIERKYDAQFKVVFDAIRELMTPPEPHRKQIGFTKTSRSKQ